MSAKDASHPRVKVQEQSDQVALASNGILLNTRVLGYGSYSKVKEGYDTNRKQKIAVKIIDRLKAPMDFLDKFLPRELKIWSKIKHPNIIQMYEYKVFNNKVFMLIEIAEIGDMLTYLQKTDGAVNEDECKYWMKQLCDAIAYLHERNIIHRDLKLENLLIDSKRRLKLCDFGFAKELSAAGKTLHRANSLALLTEVELSRTYCGSKAYASPEILQGEPYDPRKADIWATGCIFFILMTGKMPFKEDSSNSVILKQVNLK